MAALSQPSAQREQDHRSRQQRQRWRRMRGWGYVLPLILLICIVILAPALSSVYFAFTKWSGIGPAKWIGFDNFERMFADRVFWKAMANNLRWLAISLTVPIALGVFGAAILAPIRRGQIFFRVAFFIPSVLASVVVAQMWRTLLSPQVGIGAELLKLGIPNADVRWLGNTQVALYAVAFVTHWRGWGFLIVMYLTAMQSVDYQLYEAARLEGASRFQEFRHVTLPGIRPTLAYSVLFTVIGSFLIFDYVYLLTQGGPANSTEVLSTLAYEAAFRKFEAGYAAAIGLSTSVIVGVVGLIFVLMRRLGWEI